MTSTIIAHEYGVSAILACYAVSNLSGGRINASTFEDFETFARQRHANPELF